MYEISAVRLPVGLAFFARSWTAGFWLAGVAMPLGAIFLKAGSSETGHLFFDEGVLSVVRSTLWQVSLSTLISGVLGLFLGVWIGGRISYCSGSSERAFSGGTWILGLLMVPYGVPTTLVGTAWVIWLGRHGILTQWGVPSDALYSLKAVILAHVFLNIPLVMSVVAEQRKNLPEDQIEAARSLGAGYFSELRWIIWPQIRWAFGSALAQVMAVCTMSFALILILGGGPPVQTLETELYQRLRYGYSDTPGAVACALWELLITLVPWGWVLFFQAKQREQFPQSFLHSSERRKERRLFGFFYLMPCLAMVCFFILPYFVILNQQIFRFLGTQHGWLQIREPLCLSLYLAGAASLIAVFNATVALVGLHSLKRSRRWMAGLTFFLGLPSGISTLVLGLGVWLAYGRWFDLFEGNLMAIIGLQATLFFPVAFRILWPVAQGVQIKQLEAAHSLGATSLRAFWCIEWPRYRVPLFSAFAAVAGASLGEIGAVSLFYSEKIISLPLLVSRGMQQYHFEEAQGVAGLLFLLSLIIMMVCLRAGIKT